MSMYFFVGLILVLFIFCLIKNLPAYTYFSKGAKEAIDICVNSFPFLVSIFIFIEMLYISGLSSAVGNFLSPFFGIFGIPSELSELVLLRPFTGSGSIAILDKICTDFGADSYIARSAAVMVSSSDTLFYITAIYFGTVKAKKLSYTIPVALFACFVSSVLSCLFCKIM